MLSNFINIRRNVKHAGKGSSNVIRPTDQCRKSTSLSEPPLLSPIVFGINNDAQSLALHGSPSVQLNLLESDEEWFPHEWLQSRDFALNSPRWVKNGSVKRSSLEQQAHANPPCALSRSHSEDASSIVTTARKKSVPKPIVIPNADYLMPKVKLGRPDVPSGVVPNDDNDPSNPPSPRLSENLSAVSGSTLARDLITSSFVLSSGERFSSRHRNAIMRQDSATLPRGSFFLPDSRSSSPVPPVPPVPAQSVASTVSECSTVDPTFTTVTSPLVPRRISRIQEIPSPATPVSTASAVPVAASQRKLDPVSTRWRGAEGAVFDGPKSALEAPERPSLLFFSSDEHSLDEFDFVPPEPQVVIASPDSDSSASYITPIAFPSKRTDLHLKRVVGGRGPVQDSSIDTYLVSSPPSSTTSENDYGELLNFDLTVSGGSGTSSSFNPSSASTGYQTFPETPNMFTPLWSPRQARYDNHRPRRRLSSLKEERRGPVRLHCNTRSAMRQVSRNDGARNAVVSLRASLVPSPTAPPSKQSNLPPLAPVIDDVDEEKQSVTSSQAGSLHSAGPPSAARPHPLAHVSSSSSLLLEEEALHAFARASSSPLLPISIDDVDPSSDPKAASISIAGPSAESPTSIPLPESCNASSVNSPASRDGPTVNLSRAPSSLQPASLKGASYPPSFARRLSPVSARSPTPSFVPPPPYHTVISDRRVHHPSSMPSLSCTSVDTGHQHSQPPSACIRTCMKMRPPLPIGPRKPGSPGQVLGPVPPPIRSCTAPPVGDTGLTWRKLRSAASKPPPKFQAPPPKWRGLTLEAAQWTFTSTELQETVSQAIQQSFEGSTLRFVKPDILEREIADERHRLELQHTDVKAQYRVLVQRRWKLMGELAGHVEGMDRNNAKAAARRVEELAEVLSTLDCLANKMHDIAHQMAQLKSLCDVHNTSALAMAVRKINGLLVRQMAEKDRLKEQVDALQTERDEAWKHAEGLAQDYDALLSRVPENAGATGDAKVPADAQTLPNGRQSRRISAVRKSSVRQSQAGLRPRSRSIYRKGRPASLVLDPVPHVPRLPLNASTSSSLHTDTSFRSSWGYNYAGSRTSAGLALAEAQREVYEMLGLRLSLCLALSPPGSHASSSRRTTLSSTDTTPSAHVPGFRPSSLDIRSRRGARLSATT